MLWVSLLSGVVLAACHLLPAKLRALHARPRSRWLSAFAGISVAYVFVHLLPEVAAHNEVVAESMNRAVAGRLIWLLTLGGFVLFYGLERMAQCRVSEDARRDDSVFWLHIGSFAFYNAVVAFLLVDRPPGEERHAELSLAWYTLAMGLHFIVNDFGLREHHRHAYDRIGKWILIAAIAAGMTLALLTTVEAETLLCAVAFLAGGVMLNVIKEELPEERESRWWAFAAGAGAYATLLLFIAH
ncbi:MAG: hypothetical protein ACF8PN_03645 [Phycisphaerales bacterium]